MGCAQTRDRSTEQEIQICEESLQFSRFTIPQINQAFFHTGGSSAVTRAKLNRVLEELGIQHTIESQLHFENFISAFVSFEEEGENYYDLTEILIGIYLLAKSTQTEKAAAIFDLYNDEAKEELSRMEIERLLSRIIEVVFSYSEKLMDNDEGLVQLHAKMADKRKEEILSKVFAFFFANESTITKDRFVKLVEQAAKKEDLVDFTSSNSIRKAIMDFVCLPKKSQVELQQQYDVGRMKRQEAAFEDDADNYTRSTSPTVRTRNSEGAYQSPKGNKKTAAFN